MRVLLILSISFARFSPKYYGEATSVTIISDVSVV